jgi:phosphoenolpyruvate synthase/pyruvate phosphate dikinase
MTAADGLRSLSSVSLSDLASVGGKAAALGEIAQAGCRVPPGFVVPREYRERALRGDLDQHAFELEVVQRCDELGPTSLAVRSSGVSEDGTDASWAGQFTTYLNVKRNDVVARIRECWQSPGSAHASAYAARHNALDRRWDLAVIVQAMVASEISGVLFTVDPVSKDSSQCAVEAVVGLGEPLVQGEVTPQSYVLDRVTGEVLEEHEGQQQVALRLTDSGIERVALDTGRERSLTEAKLSELVEMGLRLEKHFGRPQDIEWVYEGDVLSVVQSRPITTL